MNANITVAPAKSIKSENIQDITHETTADAKPKPTRATKDTAEVTALVVTTTASSAASRRTPCAAGSM